MVSLVLGVDVGNSKTHAAVVDGTGRVVGAATGSGWANGDLTDATVLGHVLEVVEQACGQRTGFAAAGLAVAGLDLPEQERAFADRVAEAAVSDRCAVVNDTFALLRAGSPTGEGIAVVAGAGINCVGVRGPHVVRFHSLGRLTGDWGGGYDVGADALWHACRSEDGRGRRTSLEELVPARFGLTRPLEVSEAILAGGLRRDRLHELAPVVYAAATDGDELATSIVLRLADEVAAFALATLHRLGADDDETVPLVLGGGLLRPEHEVLMAGIDDTLAGARERLDLRVCALPPVVGAVALALDLLGVPADQGLLAAGLRSLLV